MYLVSASEMRTMDRQTIEDFGLPGRLLMENAGRGATRFLIESFPDIAQYKVGIIAGRGNNGGDGFVIARYLAQKHIDTSVYLLAQKDQVKGDALANIELMRPLGIPVVELPDTKSFAKYQKGMLAIDLWIDGILGTGLKSDVRGYFKDIIAFINGLSKPVFAIDIPSGLNSDTGQPCGISIQAAATATFAYAKPGHILWPGAGFTGRLNIVDIGIPSHVAEDVAPKQQLITREKVRGYLTPRPADTHKGHTGHLLVVAGSPGKTGAAAMAATSAMRAGAGLVTLGVPASLNATLENLVLEAMTVPLTETANGTLTENAASFILKELQTKKCLALGPGLGTEPETMKLVHGLIQNSTVPIVLDADGINCLTGHTSILKNLQTPLILTPHPGEMARLIESTTFDVQSDRIGHARKFAQTFKVFCVLKGARTIIATPDGQAFVNPTGNSGMASGGMGDVLTGLIAGFIAQGLAPAVAAQTGVWLHGAAADDLAQKMGSYGYLASEVMHQIPQQIKRLHSAEPNINLPPETISFG